MISFYKKYARTIFDILLIVFTLYMFMYLFSLFVSIAKPIVIALLIYLIIEPFAKFLNKRLKIKKVAATTISTLIFVLILFAITITFGVLIVNEAIDLSKNVPSYVYYVQNDLVDLIEKLKKNTKNIKKCVDILK